MRRNPVISVALVAVFAVAHALSAAAQTPDPQQADESAMRILIFSKTAGFRHASIEDGVEAITRLGEKHAFTADHTENADDFSDENLAKYDAVVFLSTTGDVLDDTQQAAFERYVRNGGGYVGIHAASDTEYDWPWYGDLVGAYFAGHPRIQEAEIRVLELDHPSTEHLSSTWTRRDGWYNYRAQPKDNVTVLMELDESTYEGGTMGEHHPIAWYHEFDGGRAWYTGGGHTKESFAEQDFLQHLLGGIRWAAGMDDDEETGDGEEGDDDDGRDP